MPKGLHHRLYLLADLSHSSVSSCHPKTSASDVCYSRRRVLPARLSGQTEWPDLCTITELVRGVGPTPPSTGRPPGEDEEIGNDGGGITSMSAALFTTDADGRSAGVGSSIDRTSSRTAVGAALMPVGR